MHNFESDELHLDFSDFSIEYLHQSHRRGLDSAKGFFPEAVFGESILERKYSAIPPMREAWSGFGSIPAEIEDLLLCLRLSRPGDLAFVALTVQAEGKQPSRQYPYRVISNLVGVSQRPFCLNKADVTEWEAFAASLMSSPSWNSRWFETSSRFFLYGGGKEFNANFESEVDRLVDYITALEAALVPESDFVGRRLRERAVALLGSSGESRDQTKRFLTDMYAIRSTLVHGSPLQTNQLAFLRHYERWLEFEQLTRDLIVAAARAVPSEEPARVSFLKELWDLDDVARAQKLAQDFRAIKQSRVRSELLRDLENL
jgi:hypothetical protein